MIQHSRTISVVITVNMDNNKLLFDAKNIQPFENQNVIVCGEIFNLLHIHSF